MTRGRDGGRTDLGVDVRLLEDDAHRGGRGGVHADGGAVLLVVPLHVLAGVLEHAGRDGVPDALVGGWKGGRGRGLGWGREGVWRGQARSALSVCLILPRCSTRTKHLIGQPATHASPPIVSIYLSRQPASQAASRAGTRLIGEEDGLGDVRGLHRLRVLHLVVRWGNGWGGGGVSVGGWESL